MQVVVSTKLPATPARRTLLVFYQTVLPYLTERLRLDVHQLAVYIPTYRSLFGTLLFPGSHLCQYKTPCGVV